MAEEALTRAASKIEKARRFFTGASLLEDLELDDVTVSLAVSAAINAADAIQLLATGAAASGQNHDEAATRLRKSGHPEAAKHLRRCLAVKATAQYGATNSSRISAEATMKHADRILRYAEDLSGRAKGPK